MAEPEEVAGLVRGDRLQVVTALLAAWRHGPGERRVEEDVGLEDLAAARVDDVVGRRERALHVGMRQEAKSVRVVLVERRGFGEAGELLAHLRRTHVLPRA